MKDLLSKIGSFFTGFFNAAKRTYNKLSPEIKAAMEWASGVINEINVGIDKVPADVISVIQQKFPSLDLQKIRDGLHQIATTLGIIETDADLSLEELIPVFQQYLGKLQGSFWAGASKYFSSVLSIILSPMPLKFEAVSSLIGYVYHDLIKKK